MSNKNVRETTPGDGLRSLRSTSLFRAINFELYVKPVRLYQYLSFICVCESDVVIKQNFLINSLQNKTIMLLGVIAMLGCSGYIFYMNSGQRKNNYQAMMKSDDTVVLVRKASKWTD